MQTANNVSRLLDSLLKDYDNSLRPDFWGESDTQKYIENTLKIYWKYIGNILEIYWKYIGNVLEIYWK